MDRFKISCGKSPVYEITEENFEKATGCNPPYSKKQSDDKMSYYAMCPACDNPIQLIGLYKNTPEGGRKPYGKHTGKTIPAFASFNEEAYQNCPYSNPAWRNPKERRRNSNALTSEIFKLFCEQFDRIIFVLSRDLEIRIGINMAQSMLRVYLAEEGWLYRAATLNNIPWIFGYASSSQPIFGREVKIDGEVYKALSECSDVELSPVKMRPQYAKVLNKNGFLDIHFVLTEYHAELQGEHLVETITLWIHRGAAPQLETILRKRITMDTDYFVNLVNLPSEKARRNAALLELPEKNI